MKEDRRKVAILTGASGVLGSALLSLMRDEGYDVAACSRKSFVDNVTIWLPFDISDESEVKRFVASVVEHFGKIDILVNNAGIIGTTSKLECTINSDLHRIFEVNFFGPFYFMKTVIPLMKKQGYGTILNIASKSAVFAVPGHSAYSASKSALLAMTQSLAKEVRDGGENIRCITVSPAGIDSTMRKMVYGKKDSARQQSPIAVAKIVLDLIRGMEVPNGANVIIKNGSLIVEEMRDDR